MNPPSKERCQISLLRFLMLCLISGLIFATIIRSYVHESLIDSCCREAASKGLSLMVLSNDGGLVEFDSKSSRFQVPMHVSIDSPTQFESLVELLSSCNTIWSVDIRLDCIAIDDFQRVVNASKSIKRIRVKTRKIRDAIRAYTKGNDDQPSISVFDISE